MAVYGWFLGIFYAGKLREIDGGIFLIPENGVDGKVLGIRDGKMGGK
jgi:hypothetical protein